MAVGKQGILGALSGKIGNVTGSSWKGRAIFKGRPASVANPRTAGQVTNRNAFKSCVEFASLILASMIIPLMNRFAGDISGYNLFVSRNKNNFDENGLSIPADLNFGTGKLGDTVISTATALADTETLTVTWPTALDNSFKLATDKAYILLQNETTKEIVYQGDSGATRNTGTVEVNLVGGNSEGDTFNCYLVFLRADGTQVGNTAYDTGLFTAS